MTAVYITIEYLTRNCSSYSDNGGKYCKEYFDLYVHQSGQTTEPDPLTNNATYDKIARPAPSALGIRVSRTFSVNVESTSYWLFMTRVHVLSFSPSLLNITSAQRQLMLVVW